tara:strand:- start:151 stop:324 length:174 start_codon:yes stop_codon:yes gene_type:complete
MIATVAQLVEQLICNQPVRSSSLFCGSIKVFSKQAVGTPVEKCALTTINKETQYEKA